MAIITRAAYGTELPYSVIDANWTEIDTRLNFNESGFSSLNTSYSDLNTTVTTLSSDVTAQNALRNIHPCYFFHGFAMNQMAGDSVFFDLTGCGNHAVRGANLSDANMFATAGYVSTVDPTTGVLDSCLRIPNLNFDYNAGEKLFIYWRGIATAEGAEAAILGDGTATTTGNHGVQIRVMTTGKVYIVLYGADAKVGVASSATAFDGTSPHDFAFLMDGQNQQYGMWVDGVMDPSFIGNYGPFNLGFSFDTKNSNTFNIGSAAKAPGTATAPQSGIACKTRSLVMIRMPASYPSPSVAQITTAISFLRANPGKLLLAGAF